LVLCFLIGNLIFLYRDRIPLNFGCAVFAFLVSLPIIALAQYNPRFKVAVYPAVAGISYVVVFLGLKKLPTLPLFRNGDYSYGIYIYGWPIQQSVLYLFPDHRNWWFNFMISLPLTFAFAAASWHFVERPFLSLRKNFSYGSTEPKNYRRLAFAATLLLYGVFVSYVDDVFPLRHIFGKPAQAATPNF
jgi:peptidoglycan/LPS O-acetylase OafA/YrhL